MALILAVKEGESFFVGAKKFTLTKIVTPTRLTLVEEANGLDNTFTIAGRAAQEITPEVVVFIGDKSTEKVARICFEAPRRIKIIRGELLEQGKTI